MLITSPSVETVSKTTVIVTRLLAEYVRVSSVRTNGGKFYVSISLFFRNIPLPKVGDVLTLKFRTVEGMVREVVEVEPTTEVV
jgi:hypothetical protein